MSSNFFNNVRFNVNSTNSHPDSPDYDMDEIQLCKRCNTMKHINKDDLCGRCQPDSPEDLDKILERVESNYIPIYEHPPSHSIQPITIQNREQAKQAIQEYYTNKFLEIIDSVEKAGAHAGYGKNRYYSANGEHTLNELRQAIKQLSKRGE